MKPSPRFATTLLLSMLASACVKQDPPGTPSGEGGTGGGNGGSGGSKTGGNGGSGGSGSGGEVSGGSGGGTGGSGGGSGGGNGNPDGSAGDTGSNPGMDAGGGGCGDPMSLLCMPLRKDMPKSLKETGLFPSAPDFSKHHERMRRFVPDPPLWSDGMEKERFMLLPADKKIDNTAPNWVFPVGTIFIKTFFDDRPLAGAKLRPIETRIIRRVGEVDDLVEYDYFLYKWNEQGTDAELFINDRAQDDNLTGTSMITINHMENGAPLMINGGQPFEHTLPSRGMCNDCHHDSGLTYQTFIGFDEIRLNTKATPTSAKTQLQEFQDAGIFMKPINPNPRHLEAPDPLLLKAERFILGNCTHCHSAKGKQFDMAPEIFVANTVGKATDAQSVMPPKGWLRVVPGDPEKSVVYVQARRLNLPMPTTNGANKLRPMPPFGVNDIAADQAGLADLKAWICSLPGGPTPKAPACVK